MRVTPVASAQDRLPPIPADKLTDAQKKATAEFEANRKLPVFGPFVPLSRSPQLMLNAERLGNFLRFGNSLPRAVSEFAILLQSRRWTQQYEWYVHAADARTAGLVRGHDHLPTRLAVLAERSLLRRLEGGCQVPIGALGVYLDGRLFLRGLVADLEGAKVIRAEEEAAIGELPPGDRAAGSPTRAAAIAEIGARAEALGERLAERLLELGARPILDRIFAETRSGGATIPGADGDRT